MIASTIQVMNPETALQLYKAEKNQESEWLLLQERFCRTFFTLNLAVIGASVGVVYYLLDDSNNMEQHWVFLAIIGPLLNIAHCHLGRRQSDRCYQRFLEAITIEAKLEHLIGLSNCRAPDAERPFGADEHYIPERWIRARRLASTGEGFVDDRKRHGTNAVVLSTYNTLIASNLVLAVIIIWIAAGWEVSLMNAAQLVHVLTGPFCIYLGWVLFTKGFSKEAGFVQDPKQWYHHACNVLPGALLIGFGVYLVIIWRVLLKS